MDIYMAKKKKTVNHHEPDRQERQIQREMAAAQILHQNFVNAAVPVEVRVNMQMAHDVRHQLRDAIDDNDHHRQRLLMEAAQNQAQQFNNANFNAYNQHIGMAIANAQAAGWGVGGGVGGGGGGGGAAQWAFVAHGRRRHGTRQEAGMPNQVTFEKRDDQGRYHNESGPALTLGHHSHYWFWHGNEADERSIMHPEQLSLDIIHGWLPYVERARSYIGRYQAKNQTPEMDGTKLYVKDMLKEGRVRVLDNSNRFGKLVLCQGAGEDIAMVIVTNRTPEKGNLFKVYKTYFLRVPPTMKTAREAVAWTFRMKEHEYDPHIET